MFIASHFSLTRVTILKDKETRESKGVAFVLFLDRQMAQKAVAAVNKKQVENRPNILGGRRWEGVGVTFWLLGRLCGSFLVRMTLAACWYICVLGMVILEWINIHLRGSRNTHSCFMLQELEITRA